jgi:Holliday junction resolvasome RuvABC endonuclease subunit
MTRILAFDLGTSTGWAVLGAEGERINSGVWHLDRMAPDGYGHMLRMALDVYELAIKECEPTALAYEQVHDAHTGSRAAHVYGALEGILYMAAHAASLRLIPIGVADVKRVATGKGNSKKPAIQAAALERWQHVATLDESDALFIGEAARRRGIV